MNYHAALAHFPKITYARYKKLAAYFSDLKQLWDAEIHELIPAGLEESIAHEFIIWREQNPVERINERLAQENIQTISLNNPDYPQLLKEINDPPHTLFIRGTLPPIKQPAIGVVGTRKMTTYGKQTCQELVSEMVRHNISIVSGLALGIDGIAHQTAIDSKGITIAVLGSGVNKNNIYPSAHRRLADDIIRSGGAVISEYPPGFSPTQYSFPARNRIIAGLSAGTLVIEAPETSGALITARCALDYNREVFCVPHTIYSATGAGPNNLIKQGAHLVQTCQDILDTLQIKTVSATAPAKPVFTPNQAENLIVQCLSKEPTHIDAIIKATGLSSATINSTLLLLEMHGHIRNLGGMNFITLR